MEYPHRGIFSGKSKGIVRHAEKSMAFGAGGTVSKERKRGTESFGCGLRARIFPHYLGRGRV